MKKSTAVFVISGMIACSIVATQCANKPKQENQDEHNAVKNDSTQFVYACSMHPEVTGKEGDKCSKCGMKLETVKPSDSTATHNH